jgi:hypothetical protein
MYSQCKYENNIHLKTSSEFSNNFVWTVTVYEMKNLRHERPKDG